MLSIHEQIYERLMWERGYLFDRLPPRRLDELKDKLRIWQDKIGVRYHSLEAHPETDYDQAWTLIYKATPQGKRDSNSPREVYIVALKSDSGEFAQQSFTVNKNHIDNFLKTERIVQALQDYENKGGRKNGPTQHNIHIRYNTVNSTGLSFGYLRERMDLEFEDAAWALDSVVRSFMRNSSISNSEIPRTLDAVKAIGEEIFKSHFEQHLQTIEDHLDFTALGYANLLNLDAAIKRNHGQVVVYNHLIRSQKIEANARDYRYTALQQFKPFGSLFLTLPIWDRIDAGDAPVKVLADHLNVKPATLKHMARQRDVLELTGTNTIRFAPYLDVIDHALWPKTTRDAAAIDRVIEMAEIYGKAFTRKPEEALFQWASQKRPLLERSWHHMMHDILKGQIGRAIAEDRIKGAPGLKAQLERIYEKPVEKVKESYDNLPDLKQGYADFWKFMVARYKNDVESIRDMKFDVERRILLPVILREIEENGYRAADKDTLKPVREEAASKLWSLMLPTDQISANMYWHSPNVNIGRRFNSAALADSDFAQWPSLFKGDIKADNGVIIKPLVSSTALSDESDHMNHCIWSYSSSFYEWNYNMFSLRDGNGARLSSLTIQDYVDDNGERKVKLHQNKTKGNGTPGAAATEAANWLIAQINEGKIVPDWGVINAARSEYKACEIENTAGYDYHNEEQCRNILKVYAPCLPRRTVPTGEQTLGRVGAELGVKTMIADWIAGHDFSQGGLLKLDQLPAPPRRALDL